MFPSELLLSFSCTDESPDEEAQDEGEGQFRNTAKLDGGGGFPARPEEEAQGLLIEVNLIYLPFLYFQWLLGVLLPHFSFYIFFLFVF